MALMQDHYVVQAFAADTPDEPLHVWILPGTRWGNHHVFDAHVSHPSLKGGARDAVLIAQQISGGLVPREGVDDLLGGPFRRGMLGDIEVDDASPLMREDQ
jgi:hypothetical protein